MPLSFRSSLRSIASSRPRAALGAFLLLTTGTAGTVALRAQAVPTAAAVPATTAVQPPAKKRAIEVHADEFSDINAARIRTLRGNVRLATDGTVLRTDMAQYNYNTDVAVSPGKIVIDDVDNTISGDGGKAYYRTHNAVIQGNVKIVVRPRAADAGAPQDSVRHEFHEPVNILCDRVDFDWRTRIAVCTGHLTLKQVTTEGVTRTATAQKLIYEAQIETVTLTGDVRAQDSDGQKFDAPIATLNLKNGAEGFRMGDDKHPGVNATIIIKDEDTDAPGKGTGAEGSPPKTPPANTHQ